MPKLLRTTGRSSTLLPKAYQFKRQGAVLREPQSRRKQHNIFQVLKEKNCQPQIIQLAKISFSNEREMKIFSDEGKLRDIAASDPIVT